MRPALRITLLACVALTGCSSGHGASGDKPSAAASPSATRPSGAVARILCNTHRVEIRSNEQALAVDEASGDTAAATRLRAQIRDDIATARAFPGCNVDDLVLP